MGKQIKPRHKLLLRIVVGTAISVLSVVTDRVLPQGLDEFILSLLF